jgi:hypothetical protein
MHVGPMQHQPQLCTFGGLPPYLWLYDVLAVHQLDAWLKSTAWPHLLDNSVVLFLFVSVTVQCAATSTGINICSSVRLRFVHCHRRVDH